MAKSSKLAQAPLGAIQQQLKKILASNHFRRTSRVSRFLRFTVERFLSGTGAACKEYELGLEVFDKPATFDPRIDPIVVSWPTACDPDSGNTMKRKGKVIPS
jgi:hypothetical protein